MGVKPCKGVGTQLVGVGDVAEVGRKWSNFAPCRPGLQSVGDVPVVNRFTTAQTSRTGMLGAVFEA
jgi:hypothetical protein